MILNVNKTYLVKFVSPEKEYEVPYLAPHQSRSGERERGFFKLLGKDLTEKQILYLFKKEIL